MIWKYLNSHLGAPREYVLHGLDPGLDSASLWPSTPCVFHVATPHSVSRCYPNGSGFTLNPFIAIWWLLTIDGHRYLKKVTITLLIR
jgi:hypothetical protein